MSQTKHFIEQLIDADLANNVYNGRVVTRFPPEPNGYLHVGHVKSICLNFSMAAKYHGRCHLRFDDTNPTKEDMEYILAIKDDVQWLGFQWDSLHHASDYFEQLYDYAIEFIKQGKAYVCSLTAEEIREYRGTLTEPGRNSPYRERSTAENLTLFEKMRAGEFAEGQHVLRAKIDMASPNINMRDPVMYRILKQPHPQAGDKWCIYPMYDYAHCFSDAIENITHSLCTLEFQDHRPLYDWFLENILPAPRPQQIEFSRLNLSHTLTSKRKLKQLVDEKVVAGWDDPRMSTIVALRRRGFPPQALRQFCETIGVTKSDSVIDMSVLEEAVRHELNQTTLRVMCVLNPLKITIENLPDDHCEMLTAANHPQNPAMGERKVAFTKTIYIEHDDFMENPPKKFHRLSVGGEVRLRYGHIIRCERVIKDKAGNVVELICHYDPLSLGVNPTDRKVKGVIHWVSATRSQACQVRLYDRLFQDANPQTAGTWEALQSMLNPHSLTQLSQCFIEEDLASKAAESRYQFERLGYFVLDRHDTKADTLVFNRIVSLRDSWANQNT